jgi:hypothetical protein
MFAYADRHDVQFHPEALRLTRLSLRLIDDGLRENAEANRLFLVGFVLFADYGDLVILNTIDAIACFPIVPVIPGQAVLSPITACIKGRVADSREGRRMPVMRICIVQAFVHQIAEPPFTKPVLESERHVTAQLVDCNL